VLLLCTAGPTREEGRWIGLVFPPAVRRGAPLAYFHGALGQLPSVIVLLPFTTLAVGYSPSSMTLRTVPSTPVSTKRRTNPIPILQPPTRLAGQSLISAIPPTLRQSRYGTSKLNFNCSQILIL